MFRNPLTTFSTSSQLKPKKINDTSHKVGGGDGIRPRTRNFPDSGIRWWRGHTGTFSRGLEGTALGPPGALTYRGPVTPGHLPPWSHYRPQHRHPSDGPAPSLSSIRRGCSWKRVSCTAPLLHGEGHRNDKLPPSFTVLPQIKSVSVNVDIRNGIVLLLVLMSTNS